ncbi:MAG: GLPGLI family protein [Polaribacter sp.]|uniref:GLPGLI family protein n=1 Tax=Polaribacter sp. TaxID=1920175 RepID=UPI002F350F6A
MRNILLLFFLFFYSFTNSQVVKSLIVSYEEIYVSGNNIGNVYTNSKLFHNIDQSVYSVGSKEVASKINEAGISQTITKKTVPVQLYFKDYTENKIIKQFGKNNTISLLYNLNDFKWVLLQEEKTIAGLLCKKAISKTKGGDIIAWYTEELGVKGGPRKYDGLPGLIVYLKNKYFIYNATKIEKNIKKNDLPLKDKNTRIVTEDELKKGITTVKTTTSQSH